MKTLALTLLMLALPIVAADQQPPDVAMWNAAALALHVYGDKEADFVKAASTWVYARQEELATPGSVSLTALRAYGTMWAAWQALEAQHKVAAKAMHDFNVVEVNRQ